MYLEMLQNVPIDVRQQLHWACLEEPMLMLLGAFGVLLQKMVYFLRTRLLEGLVHKVIPLFRSW